MKHFIEIKIKPDAEMRENVLLNKVYTKFHKRLFDLKSSEIGISFPEYSLKLGKNIRVHGDEQCLQEFQSDNWLGGLKGYCDTSEIQTIPDKVVHRTISRKQANMTSSKLRRLIKRGNIELNDIKNYKAEMFKKGIDNPFLELGSSSNGHMHRRYIQFGEIKNVSSAGQFDCFGLSKTATVPWF
jgi:CRISPR-associated endonuclease Csy4